MIIHKPAELATILVRIVILAVYSSQLMAADRQPLADTHLHYDDDQAEVTFVSDALQTLRKNNVVFAIVSSKPPALALELADASGGWIIPFFMPYLKPERKIDWFRDKRVLPASREALLSGRYNGLGEIHLISGFAPPLKHRHVTIDGMLDLAEEFDVPVLVHAEASSHLYFLPLCLRHLQARIVWVHAGSPLQPDQVGKLLRACPNVQVDFSARDHMRYGWAHPIVDDEGQLLPEWHEFTLEFQNRIMLGSDPGYYEGIATWDSANTGWDYVSEVLDFHRRWLSSLPANISQKLALQNAINFYRLSAEKDLRAD